MIENTKEYLKWRKKRKTRITVTSLLSAAIIAGAGLGIGWAIHTSKNPNYENPQITLKLKSKTTTLSKMGERLRYDVESNIPLSNFTGSSITLPNVQDVCQTEEGGPGYIWWQPLAGDDEHIPQDERSGVFWNDRNDISKGVYVQIYLMKDYDGEDDFKILELTVKLHDNSGKYQDVKTTEHAALVNDSGGEVVSPDEVDNVSTAGMNMTRDTTPQDIVTYLNATNTELSGEYELTDDFVGQNINASQLAAVMFLETLVIWKEYLVDYFYYGGAQQNDNFWAKDWSNYFIDLRINNISTIDKLGTDNYKIFDIAFEQDVRDVNNYIISPQFMDQTGGSLSKEWSYNGHSYNVNIRADIPSAYYFGHEQRISKFVSASKDKGDTQFTSLTGGISASSSLLSSGGGDIISGNLNSLWLYPVVTWVDPDVHSLQQIFNAEDIAKLFWPNITWTE